VTDAVASIHHDLVPVHGGLAAPIDRVVSLKERRRFLDEAAGLPRLRVTKADLSSVHRFADGALSPCDGPMRESLWHEVLDRASIAGSDGRRYAWTIPLALPASDAEARKLANGGSSAIETENGEIVAILDDLSVFAFDKTKYVRSVYGTERVDHPGARTVTEDERTKLVGGAIRALPQRTHPEYGQYMLSPRLVRAWIREKKWDRALAFQTRNPLHRAHEYALVAGAERLTRAGFFTGVVLNPLVGELKGDDVPAAIRMQAYRMLHDRRLLGEGDKDESLWESVGYDLSDVFELIGLDIKMFYGGPKEAVMHAIYRQNHGFSDLVIGRKHADAPFDDGSPIWGDFDAQEIFDALPGELHLTPCKIGFAAYYESIGRVDLTENHAGEKPVTVSGTQVRKELQSGQRPDSRILRPEISDVLIAAYRG
jgi:sulfate adenylyltransferase